MAVAVLYCFKDIANFIHYISAHKDGFQCESLSQKLTDFYLFLNELNPLLHS